MLGIFNSSKPTLKTNVPQVAEADFERTTLMQLTDMQRSIDRSLARIEFSPDGTIIDANENFLGAIGYRLEEIKGKHHRMFVDAAYASQDEYRRFWQRLAKGESFSGQFKRVARNNRCIWIDATYFPVLRDDGTVHKVIKFARDITAFKTQEQLMVGLNEAVNQQFAVIEFDTSGIILAANENFQNAMGYRLSEIVGKHHSIFVTESYRRSNEYSLFWKRLASGERFSGEYSRMARGGREIWISASYNPIIDGDGKVERVVKYAMDITDAVSRRQQAATVSETISGSVEQFTTTITDISSNVARTASLASDARAIASETCVAVQSLDESSRVIGKIVEVIQELADQTNLLALNATIESARAGEAGRGFAVVASSVKDLAKQTAAATKNIETTVAEIQRNIQGVVGATNSISKSVTEVNTNMTTIAAAVEQQSVTMASIGQTADELRHINQNKAG
jgi:methyl-accepting chemotaxis protein